MTQAADYLKLDEIALRSGTDKASNWHDYMHAYSRHFKPYKDLPIKFLEIGLWEGGSAKLWEEYFTQAELHFIDISFDALKFRSGRSHYHLCNQESPEELNNFVKVTGGDFDVVVDDGGHTARQQLTSFSILFPKLKSGGIYVIEDLHSSSWGGTGPGSTIHFLKSLIDEVNFIGARTGKAGLADQPPEIQAELGFYRKEVKSITFSSSVAVIEKR
jgi:hypothetical protein